MFQNNKVNLVISIVAAIAIWAYVVLAINPDETRTIKNVPVKLTNVDSLQDKGLTLVGDEDYTVDVVIKGPRSETSQVSPSDIKATANVFGYPKGENEVRVIVDAPKGVSIQEVDSEYITIDVDEYMTASKLVKIKYEGEFKKGTEPGSSSAIPEEVEVSGAKSLVNDVSFIEAVVDSDDVKDTESTIETEAIPVDMKGNQIKGLNLSQDEIAVTCILYHIKTVPLEVPIRGEVSSDYEVTEMKIPKVVTIKGIKSQIDKISKLSSKNVNISNITETTEIPLEFNFPENVELADVSNNISIIIEISGISVKSFTFDSANIELENVKDGYQAQVDEDTITVSVYGEKSIIDDLNKSDLHLFLNMSGADYSEDTFTGSITCAIDIDVREITIEPETIQVIINEAG